MALDFITIEQPHGGLILKKKARKVRFPLSQKDQNLIDTMKNKLHDLGGVGLAAPQINVSKQIIAIYIPEEAKQLRDNTNTYPMHILINPSYEPVKDTIITDDFEACYSVSSKAGKVPRYHQIKISYDDEQGIHHQQLENGFYARVLQHEIDHLNGILITDRLTPECIQGTLQEMMVLRRSELSPEKQVLFDETMAKKFKKTQKP